MQTQFNVVNIDPELMGGTPVFRGTRVPIKSLFDWLESYSMDEFLDNFPSVQREMAIEVLAFSGRRLIENQIALENELVEADEIAA